MQTSKQKPLQMKGEKMDFDLDEMRKDLMDLIKLEWQFFSQWTNPSISRVLSFTSCIENAILQVQTFANAKKFAK